MARPDYDGVMFVGFHLTSDNGYGVLIDKLKVENWGPVGIDPSPELSNAVIYSYEGNILIKANTDWQGAELRIVNMMGQEVYHDNFDNNLTINMEGVAKSGIYIVTLSKDNEIRTEKVMIR